MRSSDLNPDIITLYNEYLEKPGSHKAHHVLHTSYNANRVKYPTK